MTTPTDPFASLSALRSNPAVAALAPQQRDHAITDSGFADMLERAARGETSSGLPVSIDPTLNIELSADGMERLAHAADRAEAAGLDRALVLVEGRALVVDVPSRTVVEALTLEGQIIRGLDGAVQAAHTDPDPSAQPFIALPPSVPISSLSSRWLSNALSGADTGAASGATARTPDHAHAD